MSVSQSLDRLDQLRPELLEILTGKVLEFLILEVAPDAFLRIEIGRITGHGSDLEPIRFTGRQILFDLFAAVDRSAIPEQQHLPRNLALQMLQKADNGLTVVGFLLHQKGEFAILSDRSDDREMIAGE